MTLEELKALCAAATPGPWPLTAADQGLFEGKGLVEVSVADAAFIIAARAALPKLIAIAEAAGKIPFRPSIAHRHLMTPGMGELKAAFAALEES